MFIDCEISNVTRNEMLFITRKGNLTCPTSTTMILTLIQYAQETSPITTTYDNVANSEMSRLSRLKLEA